MKVNNRLRKTSDNQNVSGAKGDKVSKTSGGMFKSQLKLIEGRNYEEQLKELVDRIVKQGKKFAQKADIRDFKIYRNLVSEFLGEALSNSHQFSKKNTIDRKGRRRMYAIVKRINNEMDDLAKEVLNSEKKNINILKRLDDIRGLLMDLLM